jgi:hypothetical protein
MLRVAEAQKTFAESELFGVVLGYDSVHLFREPLNWLWFQRLLAFLVLWLGTTTTAASSTGLSFSLFPAKCRLSTSRPDLSSLVSNLALTWPKPPQTR